MSALHAKDFGVSLQMESDTRRDDARVALRRMAPRKMPSGEEFGMSYGIIIVGD